MNPVAGKRFAFVGSFPGWVQVGRKPLPELAQYLGGLVASAKQDHDFLVIGGGVGERVSAARVWARELPADSSPRALDRAACCYLLRGALKQRTFFFAGGFDAFPSEADFSLVGQMVQAAGGAVLPAPNAQLDFAVVGARRGKGKAAAERELAELKQAGARTIRLSEAQFLELMRTDVPEPEWSFGSKPSAAGGTVEAALTAAQHQADAGGEIPFAVLVSNLYGCLDSGKLKRAFKMLRSESFRLYAKLDERRLVGVVRSQTGVGTVYAPWIRADGKYGCSTPELEDCMGLQGSPCKHLMVLLLGLARAGELAPRTAQAWVARSVDRSPTSDKELTTRAFLDYKGAEVGELDWRPTQTLPEDYYAF